MDERGNEVVFFDGRNAMEAQIGKFRDAIVPDTETTRDFIAEIESGKYDDLKDKPVVTYCTGGIRCEVLSVLMRNRGFNEVYQLDGGIVRY
ncbi:rhodanese-like domain-containing protein, partial [Acinetobacter baumannii]